MTIVKGVRPTDYVLAAAMVAAAVYIGIENVVAGHDADVAHRLDSHSAFMIPVFALAALPILWRRRHLLPALAASTLVVAASVVAFGWVTRCGFVVPLSAAFAYAVARFATDRREHLLGAAGVVLLQVVMLVQDASTGGIGALPYTLPVAAIGYGIGLLVRSRVAKPVTRPTVNLERANA